MKESTLQAHIRLQAAEDGVILWRNNSGALKDAHGRLVRYGLCSEVKSFASADLIGIGRDGKFLSVEVKAPGWRMSMSEHERAQAKWADLVRAYGGRAGFAWDMTSARDIWS